MVRCPVCSQPYSDNLPPLLLSACGHSVCNRCIEFLPQCTICRHPTHKDIVKCPVNYSLLEISNQEICEEHGLKLMAYCADDDSLLCGKCVFEHVDHDSFTLTDPRAILLSQDKLNRLEKTQIDLENAKDRLVQGKKEVDTHVCELDELIEDHVSIFRIAESEMISKVKLGTKACVQQVKQAVRKSEICLLYTSDAADE